MSNTFTLSTGRIVVIEKAKGKAIRVSYQDEPSRQFTGSRMHLFSLFHDYIPSGKLEDFNLALRSAQ